VGAFRNLLQIAPELDDSLELVYLVSPCQKAYYEKFLDADLPTELTSGSSTFPNRAVLADWQCRTWSLPRMSRGWRFGPFLAHPEPFFGCQGFEGFQVADLQFFDVPEEFGVWKVALSQVHGASESDPL